MSRMAWGTIGKLNDVLWHDQFFVFFRPIASWSGIRQPICSLVCPTLYRFPLFSGTRDAGLPAVGSRSFHLSWYNFFENFNAYPLHRLKPATFQQVLTSVP